jgi:YfiH family protein
MTLHADCQPLLFVDPGLNGQQPAIAAAHAGWRGTVADVAGQTIATMSAAFGSRPENVLVALGPAIGPCCYEVGPEVVAAWSAIAGDEAAVALTVRDGSTYFSARDANLYLLQRRGVPVAHMEVSQICTKCQGDRWFSHRGQGPLTGRFGAMIAIEGNAS